MSLFNHFIVAKNVIFLFRIEMFQICLRLEDFRFEINVNDSHKQIYRVNSIFTRKYTVMFLKFLKVRQYYIMVKQLV